MAQLYASTPDSLFAAFYASQGYAPPHGQMVIDLPKYVNVC
jgi:hypothetical protein